MSEKREFVFGVLIGVLVGIVMGIIIASSGCDPLDPKNSVNAIYLDEKPEINMGRFTKIYVSEENSMEVTIYKDNDYEGCELIVVCQSRGGNRFGLSIEYVIHPIRDSNIRIKP